MRGGSDGDPSLRYTASGDAVLDTWTGLEWRRCAEGQLFESGACAGIGTRLSRVDAAAACPDGWRVPSISELLSIVNPCGQDPSAYSAAYPDTPPASFWSDTVFPDVEERTWSVDFIIGWTEPLPDDALARLRCVR